MRLRRTLASWLFAAILLSGFGSFNHVNAQDDERQALAIASTAQSAQNEQSFEFAAEEWERLLLKFPKASIAGKAHFNAGICQIQLQQYSKAIAQLKNSIPKLDDKAVQVPTAKFYLGFAQYAYGEKLVDEDKEKATEYLTTAAKTFGDLVKSSPKFDRNDQVCYFQAGSYEKLGRMEEALAAYKNMANFKSTNKDYFFDSLFAICDLNMELGNYAEALKASDQLIAEAKPDNHSLLDRVSLLKGKTIVELADAAQDRGDTKEANERFVQADALFQGLIAVENPSMPADFPEIKGEAKYLRAYCLARLEKFEDAATLYADLVTTGDPTLADQMQAYAGSNYLSAGKTDKAITALRKAIETDSKYAVDSAHLLSDVLRKQDKFQEAYDIATKFIPKAAALESTWLVPLKLDQADAAYEIDAKRKSSIALYDALAKDHPNHKLASAALYNSAYASLKLKDYQAAIDTSDKLIDNYPESADYAYTLEVKADALLLDGKYADATKTLDKLIGDDASQDSPKLNLWKLRSGLSLFLQKQYEPAIERLRPVAGKLELAEKNAEAYHWIASSQFQLGKFANAEASFRRSLAADASFPRADEAMSFLCRCQLKQDKVVEAKKTAKTLAEQFPQTKWLSDAYYQIGSKDLDNKNFDTALINFEKVITNYDDSAQLAPSLYGAAWCHQNKKQYKQAIEYYKRLVAEFPENNLIENAKIQTASLQRMTGQSSVAIPELKQLLETTATGKERVSILLELGRAQVSTKDWTGAIKSFEELLDIAPTDKRKDDFFYELAWANRESKNEDQALKYFGKIADETAESRHAAEANFHLGNFAYDNKDYPEAITRFTQCVEPGVDPQVREKAAYKLGWSFYKQDKFPEARAAFQTQVDSFEKGDLLADGMFMLAESYYRQKKYKEAYVAYTRAKPAIDASDVVDKKLKWLTMLHGSQSANKTKDYTGAINFAGAIEGTNADESFKQDVFLELGTAYNGLKDTDQAILYWEKASSSLSKTGARAYCMIGDFYFRNKEFDNATNEFKRVYFGFGAEDAADDIKPWQAYARYESARCSFVQVSSAEDETQKQKLVSQAIMNFEALIRDYPTDRLAPEAKKQLETLKKLQAK